MTFSNNNKENICDSKNCKTSLEKENLIRVSLLQLAALPILFHLGVGIYFFSTFVSNVGTNSSLT